MSNSLQQLSSSRNNHPPKNPSTESLQHGKSFAAPIVTDSGAPLVSSSPSLATDRFLCTICVDTPESLLDVAVLPVCYHSFCLPCLASWSTVRQVCPNCKTPFATALLRRDLDSLPVQGPPTITGTHPTLEHPVDAICQSSWITLHEIHSPKHDIEASFSLPPRELLHAFHAEDRSTSRSASSPSVPNYVHEEFEDELEDHFWQEEEYHHERLMRRTRTVSNRRYGPSGYISAGRMRAAPRPSQVQPGSSSSHAAQCKPNPGAKVAAKSKLKATASSTNSPPCSACPGNRNAVSDSMIESDLSTGGRKKKMKKKSRAGVAAAKAAAEKAAAEKRVQKASERSASVIHVESALEQMVVGDTSNTQTVTQPDRSTA